MWIEPRVLSVNSPKFASIEAVFWRFTAYSAQIQGKL